MLKKKYSIIHFNNIPNFLVLSAIIPKILGSKVILDIHDLFPEMCMEKFGLPSNHYLIKFLFLEERISIYFADKIIVTNRLHIDRLRHNIISEKDFSIVLNGADEEIFPPFSNHNFNEKKVIIIFPSTISKRLGIDLLIESIDILSKKRDDFILKIFGDGEFKDELKQLLNDKQMENIVYLSNSFVDFDVLNEEYEKSHIGVIPWCKGPSTNLQMPNKIHEYFIKSLCVVAPDLEIIKVYFNNIVAMFKAGDPNSLANTLDLLIRDRNLMKSYSQQGFEFALKHSWQYYKNVYQAIIS